jgi:predicted porin
MKKTTVAIASLATLATFTVLATTSSLAQAQSSVTLYGTVDAGIESFSNHNAAKNSQTDFAGMGGELPTLWGFKGAEDLGGGQKAVFNLEGSYNSGTGANTVGNANGNGNGNGNLFGRQAYVGLGGDWGTVKLGLQVDPAFASMKATDPRGGKQSFSGLQTWTNSTINLVGNSGTINTAAVTSTTVNIFDQNAISYNYNGHGFDATVLYGLGGMAGGSSKNSVFSLGGTYKTGGLVIGAGTFHDQTNSALTTGNGTTYTNVSEYNLGAGYSFNSWSVKGFFLDVKPNSKGSNLGTLGIDEYQTGGIGAAYKVSNALSFDASYYQTKDQTLGGHIRMVALGADYALSKRTGLYALYGTSRNGGGNGFGTSSTTPVTASLTQSGAINPYGMTSNGLVVGLNHQF